MKFELQTVVYFFIPCVARIRKFAAIDAYIPH